MTRREIELARNPQEQTFRKLSKDEQAAVRKAITEGVAMWLTGNAEIKQWAGRHGEDALYGHVYTIDPNVKAEDETPEDCKDVAVCPTTEFYAFSSPYLASNTSLSVTVAPSFHHFIAIGYELDGKITLRTSVDAAFGVPKFVRFRE